VPSPLSRWVLCTALSCACASPDGTTAAPSTHLELTPAAPIPAAPIPAAPTEPPCGAVVSGRVEAQGHVPARVALEIGGTRFWTDRHRRFRVVLRDPTECRLPIMPRWSAMRIPAALYCRLSWEIDPRAPERHVVVWINDYGGIDCE